MEESREDVASGVVIAKDVVPRGGRSIQVQVGVIGVVPGNQRRKDDQDAEDGQYCQTQDRHMVAPEAPPSRLLRFPSGDLCQRSG